MSGFLAIATVALPSFLAVTARAAEVQITRIPDRAAFLVTGGTGAQAWHIQYGLGNNPGHPAPTTLSAAGPQNIAFFTHESWLRRIDVEKGVVTGRWHFPGVRISNLTWKDDHLQVEVEDRSGQATTTTTIDFNPDKPQFPYWPTALIFWSSSLPETETYCCHAAGFSNTAQANQSLSEVENTVHRDPLSPWFQIELAHIYKVLGRPGATELFQQAIRIDGEDYSELLRISSTLDEDGLPQLAGEAFERGYAAFWKRGMDPRLNSVLLGALVLYPPPRKISDTLRLQLIDRRYRIGPRVEAAGYAWDSYADVLASVGKSQEATLWRDRATEARQKSLFIFSRTMMRWNEIAFALVPATDLAALLFILALYLRYLPERRLQGRAQQTGFARRFTFFNVEYWSRSDRVAFFLIGVASWIALGAAGALTQVRVRENSMPLSLGMGNMGGPETRWYLENRLPDSSERTLLLAIGYQNESQTRKAEQLYRQLPQFAESWNNLGVLLQESGKETEARQAFDQALRLDPNLPDARWNLDHKPQDFWTEMHQKFIPDRAMAAPPSREHFLRAFGAGSLFHFTLQALGGPFTTYAMLEARTRFVIPRPFSAAFILTVVEFGAGLLILLVLPYRDVTQAAYRSQLSLEYLLPGISPQWRWLGGIVLVLWAGLLVQWLASLAGVGTFAFGGFPNIQRAFGVQSATQPVNVFQVSAPYVLAGLATLYAINAVLIWRSRR
jgi:tetratricopeptide (TPR) repeat protein